MPFFDRFFIGGETTIRGFDLRSISPLAIASTRVLDSNDIPIVDLNNGIEEGCPEQLFQSGAIPRSYLNWDYRIPVAGPLSLLLVL